MQRLNQAEAAVKFNYGRQYGHWKGWKHFVKTEVEAKRLPETCMDILEDGGGKRKAHPKTAAREKGYYDEDNASPQKMKALTVQPCTDGHDFKPETFASSARPGSGFVLDGMSCSGIIKEAGKDRVCRKLFVEQHEKGNEDHECRASIKDPVYYCQKCVVIMCNACWKTTVAKDNVDGIDKQPKRKRQKQIIFGVADDKGMVAI